MNLHASSAQRWRLLPVGWQQGCQPAQAVQAAAAARCAGGGGLDRTNRGRGIGRGRDVNDSAGDVERTQFVERVILLLAGHYSAVPFWTGHRSWRHPVKAIAPPWATFPFEPCQFYLRATPLGVSGGNWRVLRIAVYAYVVSKTVL